MLGRWLTILIIVIIVVWAAWNWRAYFLLPWFELKIEREFPVTHLDADSLAALIDSGGEDILLLDTRSVDEFEVSRLDGAERVDWRQGSRDFCNRYAERLRGKKVVLYCSIGYRSSVLLQEVQKCLQDNGADLAANLEGGIFRWYNQGRTVVDQAGEATDSIHPYDNKWGHLVKQR